MRAENKYGIYPTWSDMLALLGVFVAATVLCNVLGVLLVRAGSVSEGFSAFVCYGVQFAVTILYALWVRRHRTARGTKLLRFGVRRVDPAVVLWGLVMTIATSLVVEPLVDWMPEGMLELLNRQMGLGGWMMLTSIVLAPVLEEILFRGIVQDSLTEKLGPLRGILIGTCVFGIVHIIPQQVINAFFVGIVLGFIYYRSGSLVPVILIHMINNAISYFSWVLSGERIVSTRQMIGNDTIYYIVYALACAVFVVALITIVRTLSRDKAGRFVGSADREEATGREKVSSSDDNINGL